MEVVEYDLPWRLRLASHEPGWRTQVLEYNAEFIMSILQLLHELFHISLSLSCTYPIRTVVLPTERWPTRTLHTAPSSRSTSSWTNHHLFSASDSNARGLTSTSACCRSGSTSPCPRPATQCEVITLLPSSISTQPRTRNRSHLLEIVLTSRRQPGARRSHAEHRALACGHRRASAGCQRGGEGGHGGRRLLQLLRPSRVRAVRCSCESPG